MMYENDKLIIPEKYRNMSVSELRREKERIYKQIKDDSSNRTRGKVELKKETGMFHF